MKKLILLIVAFYSMQLTAQDIITDRPDQTESSSTLLKGFLQIEGGILYYENPNQETTGWQVPSVLFRYGLSNTVEIRLVTQFETHRHKLSADEKSITNSGLGDVQVGVKLQLLNNENSATQIAFLTHAVLPTGKTNISSESFGLINKLAISHDLKSSIGLGYNIGYDYIGEKHYLTYAMALGFDLGEKLAGFIEPYGTYGEYGDFESNFDLGLTYLLRSNLQLDLSYGTGLNHKMNFISTGISWRSKHK